MPTRVSLLIATALVACNRTAAPEMVTELPAAAPEPERSAPSGANPAAGGGCPAPQRIGVVTDAADLLGERAPVLAFSGARLDIDGAKAGLTEARRRRELSERDARELGASVSAEPIWVLADERRAACRLEPRRRFLVVGSEPWELMPLVHTEVTGDCEIPHGEGRIAVQSAVEPTACRVRATTDGEELLVRRADAPPVVREAFEGTACAPPCELRTELSGVSDAAGRRLEWVAAAHVYPRPGVDECSWEHEDYLTLLARDVGGAVRAVEAYGLDEVLIERDSIVAFIDREVHRFDVWAWPPASAPAIVQTVQYGWAHEEDFERLALSPYCGP